MNRPRFRIPFVPLFLAALFFIGAPPASGSAVKPDSDLQLGFAEHLFSEGDYPAAVAEYRRFLFLFPEDERTESVMFRIGDAYIQSRRPAEAIDAYNSLIDRVGLTDLGVRAHFRIAESYLFLSDPAAAIAVLDRLILLTDTPSVLDEAWYRIGWLHLETGSWEDARQAFGMIRPENIGRFRLETLYTELAAEREIPRKSPVAAGLLGVIPGGGYVYTERYRDAVFAFLLNGALILASIEAFDNESPVLGSILAFAGAGFYAGSIYGSISSAHKHNEAQRRAFIDRLRANTTVQMSAAPEGDRFYLTFGFRF
jgi:tetratricopeptide (TPR) repeat protein